LIDLEYRSRTLVHTSVLRNGADLLTDFHDCLEKAVTPHTKHEGENTMASDPVAAGRKGGQSRSEKKIAAARRNGFQRVYPAKGQTNADASKK
jgi:hypothetical protein